MTHFHYVNQRLHCEGVDLATISAEIGTPVYVYSQQAMVERVSAVGAALQAGDLACYAVKANANLALLKLIASHGLGADVTSSGELYLALKAGFAPERILFSGVGKTSAEIQQALDADIRAIHVESEMELHAVAAIAEQRNQVARIGIRVNPDIAAATHPAISTGRASHKFGVSAETALHLLQFAASHPHLHPVGLAAHIGSQIRDLTPFRQVAIFLASLAEEAQSMGIGLAYLDAGGGLGVVDHGNGTTSASVPTLAEWISAVADPIHASGHALVVEPGRSLMADAGALLTQVVYTKNQGGKVFAIVDAGMADLIRPTLYDAYHPIFTLNEAPISAEIDIVGPICETGDWLARSRPMPELHAGDLLAVMQAGAYGFAMSSNYNGRLRSAEVLVDGNRWSVIRPRQTFADLLK